MSIITTCTRVISHLQEIVNELVYSIRLIRGNILDALRYKAKIIHLYARSATFQLSLV